MTAPDPGSPPGDRRFPRSVYRAGAEPDVRFTLANERTFLAWIRTSLALIAGGVALEALGLGLQPGFRLAASIVLIVTGIAAPAQAWVGWMRTERALRRDARCRPPRCHCRSGSPWSPPAHSCCWAC
ncbi:hypothetical protein ABUV78_02793 [Clavibacter nebraskensis]